MGFVSTDLLHIVCAGQYIMYNILVSIIVSCPAPFHTRREIRRVLLNVYRACVAHATYSARQSDARIKSHDCAGMNGMHINDCVRARSFEI